MAEDIDTIAIEPVIRTSLARPRPHRRQDHGRSFRHRIHAIRDFPRDDWLTPQNRERLLASSAYPEPRSRSCMDWRMPQKTWRPSSAG
ncbi:hypothetical protein [Mesorhizobium sp.]|uniref:hypothetical protein n=1 Tax=Mesorhizobium sp. TaxID=1871066 RepID=UPI000FE699D1|nr:hypothetical protein [Mesorhizobium sp.]RWO53140.1 MAG: hypothetical protein EOS14_33905 [Mesorhizobium sp.]TIL47974.1 MAG: hypothetical protein E5Y83_33440 [Mesorhizobium sp.]